MPGEDGGGAAIGAPPLRQRADELLGGARVVTKDAADLDLHRQVAGGPDVGPSFREEQIDLCRPAADAFHADERGDRLLIVGG